MFNLNQTIIMHFYIYCLIQMFGAARHILVQRLKHLNKKMWYISNSPEKNVRVATA